MLQVVGVDHILQAADIAFIEEDELKELESWFEPHARSVAEALIQARKFASSVFSCVVCERPRRTGT